jgi:hypothetical protein
MTSLRTRSLLAALALSVAAGPARADTCGELDAALLRRTELDPAAWPALLQCAQERFVPLATQCLDGARERSVDAVAGWDVRPEVLAGRRGLHADASDADGKAARDLDAEAARRAASDDGIRDDLPGDEVLDAERDRLVETPDEPMAARDDGPGCPVADARRAADLYDRILTALPRVPDEIPADSLCSLFADAAAARVWAGRDGAATLLQTAEGLAGRPCGARLAPLQADPRIASATDNAIRAVASASGAWLIRPGDASRWRLDAASLPEGDGPVSVAPGLHRVEYDGTPPLFTLVDVPPASDVQVSVDGGRIVVTATPTVDPDDGLVPSANPPGRRVRLGVRAGFAEVHRATFGVAGLSLEVALPRVPMWVEAGAMIEATTSPVWLDPIDPVDHLLRGEIGVGVDPFPRWKVAPVAAVLGYRESEVTWGLEPRVGARVDLAWASVSASFGIPLAFNGEKPAFSAGVTLAPGARPRDGRP